MLKRNLGTIIKVIPDLLDIIGCNKIKIYKNLDLFGHPVDYVGARGNLIKEEPMNKNALNIITEHNDTKQGQNYFCLII